MVLRQKTTDNILGKISRNDKSALGNSQRSVALLADLASPL
jgi:hypothetical protein